MVNIILEPNEVWLYAIENSDEIKEFQVEIASDSDSATKIYLHEKDYAVMVSVEENNKEVYCEVIADYEDSVETVEKIYNKYLYEYDELFEQEQEIHRREQALDDLIIDFVVDVADANDIDADMDFEDFKNHILEYMYRKYGISPYRPSILVDKDGNEFFEEYPYPFMEFEDENDPIYK